jgi:hypothetical protein
MAAGRFKYAIGSLENHVWDRSHFIVSVDPMRVVTVPGTLNADTGLACCKIGSPEDLENMSVFHLLERANPVSTIWGAEFHTMTVALSPKGL